MRHIITTQATYFLYGQSRALQQFPRLGEFFIMEHFNGWTWPNSAINFLSRLEREVPTDDDYPATGVGHVFNM